MKKKTSWPMCVCCIRIVIVQCKLLCNLFFFAWGWNCVNAPQTPTHSAMFSTRFLCTSTSVYFYLHKTTYKCNILICHFPTNLYNTNRLALYTVRYVLYQVSCNRPNICWDVRHLKLFSVNKLGFFLINSTSMILTCCNKHHTFKWCQHVSCPLQAFVELTFSFHF